MIIVVRCRGNIASVVNETTSLDSVSPWLPCASLWKSLLQSRQFKKVSVMPPGGHLARLPLWGNLRPGTTFNQLDNFRNHARNTVALVACRPKLNEPTPAPSRWITMRRFPEKACIIRNLTVRERERERERERGRRKIQPDDGFPSRERGRTCTAPTNWNVNSKLCLLNVRLTIRRYLVV